MVGEQFVEHVDVFLGQFVFDDTACLVHPQFAETEVVLARPLVAQPQTVDDVPNLTVGEGVVRCVGLGLEEVAHFLDDFHHRIDYVAAQRVHFGIVPTVFENTLDLRLVQFVLRFFFERVDAQVVEVASLAQ